MIIWGGKYLCINVGDTRCYKIEEDIKQITMDHTLLEEKLRNGLLTSDEAKESTEGHILTRCIGVNQVIAVDYFKGSVDNGIYLICSDGFRNKLSEDELLRFFGKGKNSVDKEIIKIFKSCVEKVKDRGEKDNISAVAIERIN